MCLKQPEIALIRKLQLNITALITGLFYFFISEHRITLLLGYTTPGWFLHTLTELIGNLLYKLLITK